MNESDRQIELVPSKPSALTKVGTKSLVARGRADLSVREEAEEWLKKGLDFHSKLQFEEGFACFERGIQLNPNHPEIQRWLGNMLTNGEGVRQDYTQAASWYRKAAEQGNAWAQCCLGTAYSKGQGVTQDYVQAAQWYLKAAEQGNAWAQYNLGNAFSQGQGVNHDRMQAAFWWRKAAEQGCEQALAALRDM